VECLCSEPSKMVYQSLGMTSAPEVYILELRFRKESPDPKVTF
jgi:hypothetical protein